MIKRLQIDRWKQKTLLMTSATVLVLTNSGALYAGGMSMEQGDAILGELRQIRQLLEKQQKQAPPPVDPANQPEKVKAQLSSGDYIMGNPQAPLTVIEYTDYQCPFCNKFDIGAFPEIKKNFIDTGKLRLIIRDLPLDFHNNAMKAAQATRCAGVQGKYWQMRELFINNPGKIEPAAFMNFARELSLDLTEYQRCVDNGTFVEDIKNGILAANSLGISGTPSFLLGNIWHFGRGE